MTVVVTRPEDLDNGKVRPTDSIVFLKDGIATAINSSLVDAGMHTLEEYCQQHGWMLPTTVEPARATFKSRVRAMIRRVIG